jgi:hypothetical protein
VKTKTLAQRPNTKARAFMLDAAKSIDGHIRSGRYNSLAPERAFVHWFVEARYGATRNVYISDGAADGGIDAVVKYGDRWIVLQSKYERAPALGAISQKPLDDLAKLSQLLRSGDQDAVDAWLGSVHSAHRKRYRVLAEAAHHDPSSVEFVLVSNRLGAGRSTSRIVVEGIEKVGELWRLYELGLSPPAEELTIEWQQQPLLAQEQGMRSWVGFVEIADFLRAMKHDPAERLFAENVRTHLHSMVNRQIADTYRQEPGRFWLGNNGIYVVCRHSRLEGLRHHLNFASIINGSQTLHSVEESARHPRSCKVLVRLLEIDGHKEPDLLNAIIRRTNSQNHMKLVNLFAHDAPQVNVARYLQRFKLFYERREREWQNEKRGLLDGWLPVGTLQVVQWLTVARDPAAVGLARTQPARLFDEDRYKILMRRRFTRDLQGDGYRELALCVWCGLVCTRLPKQFSRTGSQAQVRRAAKIARLFLVRVLYRAVKTAPELQNLNLDEFLPRQQVGRELPGGFVRRVGRLLRDVVKLQEREQATNDRLDLSNFFKGRETTELAEQRLVSTPLVRELAGLLTKGRAQVR